MTAAMNDSLKTNVEENRPILSRFDDNRVADTPLEAYVRIKSHVRHKTLGRKPRCPSKPYLTDEFVCRS